MDLNNRKIRILFNAKRFTIATMLYLRGKLTMAELHKYTGLTWGDLDSNIRILSKHGLVESKKTITRGGVRTIIQLTEEGEKTYEELSEALQELIKYAKKKNRTP